MIQARFPALALILLLAGLAPAQEPEIIKPETVRKVKQATVYLRVTGSDGEVGQGSGFLAVEPGIVITNAHVVGMLHSRSKPPTKLEVVIHSGETNEIRLTGKVLGVDRGTDLALISVEGKLPAPLELGVKEELTELQKLYIFGFPFGEQLGKNITVSESSVSSLRKDAGGNLEKIQVNGGMHPGNSGGPVVNAKGQLVGVSVAGIRGTQINFAIPALAVQTFMEGSIQETRPGEVFKHEGEMRVPVQYKCLDPFQRIKEIRVEVWAGKPATNRSFSSTEAKKQDGDGPRQTVTLKYASAVGSAEVPLPKLAAGQVAWVQPVVVLAKREHWGAPQPFDISQAVERLPADLVAKFDVKERTVHLKSSQSLSLAKGKEKVVFADKVELDILEVIGPDPKGFRVSTTYGPPSITFEERGRQGKVAADVVNLIRQFPPSFIVDATNKLRVRIEVSSKAKIPPLVLEQAREHQTHIFNAYEAAHFILPNRNLKPGETWRVQLPLLFKGGVKSELADLVLTCTYEGIRTRNGNPEAVVTFEGPVEGRGAMKTKVDGHVSGKFTFDSKRGFISSVNSSITSDSAGSDITAVMAFDIELTRVEGNTRKLQLPGGGTPPKGEVVIVNKNGVIMANEALDPKLAVKPGGKGHVVPVPLEKGKKYVILLNSTDFDSYLRLIDPMGMVVAEDDDSGGNLNSRIEYTPVATGQFKVVVTSFDGKVGAYNLRVLGEKGEAVKPAPVKPAPVKPGELPPVKASKFTKPALSEAPVTSMHIDSSQGDFIGQGKSYEYSAEQIKAKASAQGVLITVEGWRLNLAAPKGQKLEPGEYLDAKRYPFNGESPGLDFSGNGRGSNRLAGEFVIWELEITNGEVTRLAVDFLQRSEEKGPPLTGRVRINSAYK